MRAKYAKRKIRATSQDCIFLDPLAYLGSDPKITPEIQGYIKACMGDKLYCMGDNLYCSSDHLTW